MASSLYTFQLERGDSMKAEVWYGRNDVRVVDIPEPPSPPLGWVKIEVERCGICGSDLHEYVVAILIPVDKPHPLTGGTAPIILGHEFSGTIVEVGESVEGWNIAEGVAPSARSRTTCLLTKRSWLNPLLLACTLCCGLWLQPVIT